MPTPPAVPSSYPNNQDALNIAVESPDMVFSAFAKVPSRWPLVTKTVRIGSGVAGVGIQVTQQALSTTTIIALFTGAAAASATGIGLIVGGAAITLGSITASARSAFKTHRHLKVLNALLERADGMPCDLIGPDGAKAEKDAAEHQKVQEALAYLINKKGNKRIKKVGGTVGLGIGVSLYGMGKAIYKLAKGTKGVNRTAHAHVIAKHLVTHNCALAQGIVAELYSPDEMLWMLERDSSEVAALLAEKMKST
ncbi:hypothetical protein ACLB1G_21215 [Oxalobacteraceae bacterium A2-2]